jgi:hypothetical protein
MRGTREGKRLFPFMLPLHPLLTLSPGEDSMSSSFVKHTGVVVRLSGCGECRRQGGIDPEVFHFAPCDQKRIILNSMNC